jgi:hypothetical protein
VSSILDALQKVESATRTRSLRDVPPPAARRSLLPSVLVALGVAFVAGAGVAWWLGRAVPPPPAEPLVADAPPAPEPRAVDVPAAPATPAVTAAAVAVPPAPAPAAPAPAAPAPATPPPAAPLSVVASPPEPQAPPAAVTPPPVAVAPPVAAAPPPPPPPAVEPAASGGPRVHVSFLAYSSNPERRSVALNLEDGTLVMLHEGEGAADFVLARIFPDHIELRQGGRLFAVHARGD